MNYPSLTEIVNSSLISIIFGCCVGILYAFIGVAVDMLREFAQIPKLIKDGIREKGFAARLWKKINISKSENGVAEVFIRDFIAALLSGIGFILLIYVCTDGIFRIYVIVISILCTYITYSYVGKWIERTACKIISLAVNFTLSVIIMIVRPIFVVFSWSIRNLKPRKSLDKV